MKSFLDTHDELLVMPWNGGIKLIKPNKKNHSNTFGGKDELQNIYSLMQLPVNVYFMNCESVIQNINEATLNSCSFPSKKDTIGKTVEIAAIKEVAKKSLRDDCEVMNERKMKIFEENFTRRADDLIFHAISFKFPWYTDDNKIIGVFGCSIILGKTGPYSLADALNYIVKYGLFSEKQCNPILSREINGVQLSNQELNCLRLLMKGGTFKMIAKALQLSPRTVESYLENIKSKFNVNSKSALIDSINDWLKDK